jgi:hypothetical protein
MLEVLGRESERPTNLEEEDCILIRSGNLDMYCKYDGISETTVKPSWSLIAPQED